MYATIWQIVNSETENIFIDLNFFTKAILKAYDVKLDILYSITAQEQLNRLDQTLGRLSGWREFANSNSSYCVAKRQYIGIDEYADIRSRGTAFCFSKLY